MYKSETVLKVFIIFSLFKAMTKPRPSDNPVLIIFVLGGITSQEVRLVKETVSASKSPVQVMC